MKKLTVEILIWACVLALFVGRGGDAHMIRIAVPARSAARFVYSDEQISATGKKITVSCGAGLGDTEVVLSPVRENVETGYTATYLTPGMSASFDAVPGEWFRVGVSVQNPTDTGMAVFVKAEGVNVRVE